MSEAVPFLLSYAVAFASGWWLAWNMQYVRERRLLAANRALVERIVAQAELLARRSERADPLTPPAEPTTSGEQS